jgi:hypothetical protein
MGRGVKLIRSLGMRFNQLVGWWRARGELAVLRRAMDEAWVKRWKEIGLARPNVNTEMPIGGKRTDSE